ncbi:hypothetical protein DL89DRAFT_271203 [Linderina pennispora]|uniref:Uncharacterized protein n=1 Tax=Linderina pennispora TaxID=61395 RepID=A0A1Y1VVC7_9FUNG|nr:uncharacterized protein DL89DRAFT_271203 [Linderina pennispora]ORX65242.1 hypothetical protein DL89DRAFT_271203 [Linderina pennispora]
MSYEDDQLTKKLRRMEHLMYEINYGNYELREWGQKYYDSKLAQSKHLNHHGINAYLKRNLNKTGELQQEVSHANRMLLEKKHMVDGMICELDRLVASDPHNIRGTHEDVWSRDARNRATKSIELLMKLRVLKRN